MRVDPTPCNLLSGNDMGRRSGPWGGEGPGPSLPAPALYNVGGRGMPQIQPLSCYRATGYIAVAASLLPAGPKGQRDTAPSAMIRRLQNRTRRASYITHVHGRGDARHHRGGARRSHSEDGTMAELNDMDMGWSGAGWMDPAPMSSTPEPAPAPAWTPTPEPAARPAAKKPAKKKAAKKPAKKKAAKKKTARKPAKKKAAKKKTARKPAKKKAAKR